MTYQNILTTQNNKILTLTINRPDKLNALNTLTLSEIDTAITKAIDDASVWGIIITGAGEKAFVAGADIKEFKDFDIDQGRQLAANGHAIFNRIEQSPKPIIAAVNGFALGGGCELAMACHLRIASTNAKFGQPEVNLGIIPGYGGTQRLVQLIGKTKALELLMTADMVKAEKALDLGLVNAVVEQSDLIASAEKMLEKIFTKSPLAIKKVIQSVNAYFHGPTDGFEFEINAFASCCKTDDFIEGTSAFIEKRRASFKAL